MRFNDDPADWVSSLSIQRERTLRSIEALEQICSPDRKDLASTMRMALALMAIRDAQVQRSRAACDFSDLLSASPSTRPAAPPIP